MKLLLAILVLFCLSFSEELLSADTLLLKKHVLTLVSRSEPRNYKHPEILDSVAMYIKNEFSIYGYTDIREQKFMARDRYESEKKEYKNIIASIGPEGTETIVIGAHYDVFSHLPGADDNASGVAGLLECARIIYKHKNSLKHRIEFVAYTLEEPPYFKTIYMGSYQHASYLSDLNIRVKLMICLEMIGYFTEERHTQEYPLGILKPFYGTKGNFIACIADFRTASYAAKLNNVYNKQVKMKSKYLISPKFIPGIGFSDHRNYWGYKMKALMITDGANYRNFQYHTSGDTFDILDFEKMAKVATGAAWFILGIK